MEEKPKGPPSKWGLFKKFIGSRLFAVAIFFVDTATALAIFLVCYAIEWLRKRFFPNADGPILWLWEIVVYSGYIIASALIIKDTIMAIVRCIVSVARIIKYAFVAIKALF